ncbi:hypothetical protein [Mesorhizobium sp. M0898]|uniref:hypothetical protein n=1 Tax=Mesorhizobium sp. M0898 TaxID=2957020 RepID=UPI00333C2D4B
MKDKNAFLKILHVSTLTIALACDVLGALAQNNSDFDEKAFVKMVRSGKCDDAFRSIWHRVATGEVKPTEILSYYIENNKIVLDDLNKYDMSDRKISLMLQMKIFGRGSRGSDNRLMRRLLSPEIMQPGGKKIGACLAASKGSGEAVQECIENAQAVGIVDDFMKFYFYADKAMNDAVIVQCGRN